MEGLSCLTLSHSKVAPRQLGPRVAMPLSKLLLSCATDKEKEEQEEGEEEALEEEEEDDQHKKQEEQEQEEGEEGEKTENNQVQGPRNIFPLRFSWFHSQLQKVLADDHFCFIQGCWQRAQDIRVPQGFFARRAGGRILHRARTLSEAASKKNAVSRCTLRIDNGAPLLTSDKDVTQNWSLECCCGTTSVASFRGTG